MAPTQKRAPSKRSRAARRATSPSINTDKSLKDVSLPSTKSSSEPARPSVLAARHSAGVTKKSRRGRQLSAKGRRRQEKGLEMAEAFVERTSKKLEKSLGKAKVVQARSKKWDDINKDVQETKANAFAVLGQDDDEANGGEWETDDDMDGDDGVKGKCSTGVVLVRDEASATSPTFCFDYNDLNAYLLTVVGVSRPESDQATLFHDIMTKAQGGARISLREIQTLCSRETIVKLDSGVNLAQAIEKLGSGIHRILVTEQAGNVIGIISQLRMVEFFWNEGINFPTIDRLNPVTLQELGIGVRPIISVHADAPLTEALSLMYDEGLSSVAIVDNGQNVVGNISTKDVRHLTSSSSAYLLGNSCMHFISIILNEKGVEKGQDVYPVFYVNPYSTLAHTVAKLVATKSHRMWIVDAGPQSSPMSTPTTPMTTSQTSISVGTVPGPIASAVPAVTVPAASMAGALLSGKLIGVVSLTDILNIFAKSTGLHPSEPWEQRVRRRRSSSSSVRPSVESLRSSVETRR